MAASIESRVPFLDHTFVEFAARIPDGLKIRGRTQKHILKAAMSDLLPRGILHRKKMGFPTPLARWLRDPRAEPFYAALRSPDGLVAAHFDLGEVDALIEAASLGTGRRHRSHLAASQPPDLGRPVSHWPARASVGRVGGACMKILWVKAGFSASHQRWRADPDARNPEAAAPQARDPFRRARFAGAWRRLPPQLGILHESVSGIASGPAKERTALLGGAGHRHMDEHAAPRAALPITAPCCAWWRFSRASRNSTPSCAIFSHRRPTSRSSATRCCSSTTWSRRSGSGTPNMPPLPGIGHFRRAQYEAHAALRSRGLPRSQEHHRGFGRRCQRHAIALRCNPGFVRCHRRGYRIFRSAADRADSPGKIWCFSAPWTGGRTSTA